MSEYVDLTPDQLAELAARIHAAETFGFFVRNLETQKLELHFEKSAYDALDDDAKRQIKGAFLWGRRSGCWISRHKEPNLSYPQRVAEQIGLVNAGEIGQRLTFAQQQQRKADRAETRAQRLEAAAERAERRADAMTKPIEDMRGDIAFFTQPNINTSAGRAFTRQRERMFDRYFKGGEEYQKAQEYRNRAELARGAAAQNELKDADYLLRRIREREADIRRLCVNITAYAPNLSRGTEDEQRRIQAQIDTWNAQIETKLDELSYYKSAYDALK